MTTSNLKSFTLNTSRIFKVIYLYKIPAIFRRIFWGVHLEHFHKEGEYTYYFLITGHVVPHIDFKDRFREYKTIRIPVWKQKLLGFSEIKSYFGDTTHGGFYKTGYSVKEIYGNTKVLSDAVLKVTIKNINSASEALFYAEQTRNHVLSKLSLTYSHSYLNNVKTKNTGVSYYSYKGSLRRIGFRNKNGLVERRLRLYTTYTNTQILGPEYYTADWRDETADTFFEAISTFEDPVFMTALKYIYHVGARRSVLDFALNDMKSIEVILNNIGSESNTFAKNCKRAKTKLNLSDEFIENLKKLWEQRSKTGDIAHPRPEETYESWLQQRDTMQQYGGFSSSESVLLLLKYYQYKKKVFTVEIWRETEHTEPEEGVSEITNRHQTYVLQTSNKNKNVWKSSIKKYFAERFNIKQSKISFLTPFKETETAVPEKEIKVFVDFD